MATAKEVKEHLEIALKEVGEIKPWFDKEVNEWIFSHSVYPVEYGGKSAQEVIKNYPRYLREFIMQRLNNNLNPLTENKAKGHGGILEVVQESVEGLYDAGLVDAITMHEFVDKILDSSTGGLA
jgi:hypothetical protein